MRARIAWPHSRSEKVLPDASAPRWILLLPQTPPSGVHRFQLLQFRKFDPFLPTVGVINRSGTHDHALTGKAPVRPRVRAKRDNFGSFAGPGHQLPDPGSFRRLGERR